jgi:hypothetical protein
LAEDLLGDDWMSTGLRDIWGTAPDNVYAVGGKGLIVHYDGTVWTQVESGTTAYLTAIWGSGADDIYAVGNGGTVLHFDGATWSRMTSGSKGDLNDVWGSSPSDVYVVGETTSEKSHVILHGDGVEWTEVHSGEGALLGIQGLAHDDIFAVGGLRNDDDSVRGVALHFGGDAWRPIDIEIDEFLWDVAITASGEDYYFVGPDNTIVHGER